ncbi:MAG TPA: hypothetical protein DCP31_41720 [Cyanobacteria bacterium UBA8543]|nr:hypothetical protein [Cyanobacteria bacterium UBA8543]
METLDTITLKAFVAALMRLDDSLPKDVQNQLNEIAQEFLTDVSKLHTLAKDYSPLTQEYMDARLALQKDGERFRADPADPDYSAEISNDTILSFAIEVFKADDSVNFVKKKAQESSVLGHILFRLRRQTSFMVINSQYLPKEELWLWQDSTAWAALERGLRQAAARDAHYLGSFAQYADLDIDD